jgi:hypothetical protein
MSTLTLEVLAPFTVRQHGQITTWHAGHRVTLSQEKAQRVLARVGDKVRVLDGDSCDSRSEHGPTAPLKSGWLVVYRDRDYSLCGGSYDRLHGTVRACTWDGTAWTVTLTDGQQLHLRAIRSVGKTDVRGQVIAAWTVEDHGYDGEGVTDEA